MCFFKNWCDFGLDLLGRLRWATATLAATAIATVAVTAGAKPLSFPTGMPSCTQGTTARLAFVGDVYIGSRGQGLLSTGSSPSAAQALATATELAPLFEATEALVANLEGPLTRSTEPAFPLQTFLHKMDPALAKLLARLGLTGVTLGNNHLMDYGAAGLTDTQAALKAAGLKFAGAGRNWDEAEEPFTLSLSGSKVRILSFNVTYPEEAWATATRPGVAYPWAQRLRERIRSAAHEADFVAVSFHWGNESQRTLREYQPVLAQLALEAGAQFVYGHHVHIAQSIAHHPQGTVAYGLGNFIFDSFSHKAGFGLAAVVTLCKDHKTSPTAKTSPTPKASPFPVVFMPLNTNNFVTRLKTRPMTRSEFLNAAAPYAAEGDFPKETLFWIPEESKVLSLENWMALRNEAKPASQASSPAP